MGEKEFGKLSRKELKEVYAFHYQGQKEGDDLEDVLNDPTNEKIAALLNATTPWAYFYELPFTHLLALFINITTTKTQRKKMFRSRDPAKAFMKWGSSDIKPPRGFNKWSIQDGAIFLSIVKALQYNHQCLQIFGCYLNTLIEQARSGSDNALFDAVLVDSAAVCSFTIGKRISQAVLKKDGEFFDHLAKAIKKTRPRRPSKKLDDLRFMTKILDEAVGLSNISRSQTYDLLVEDMQLYPDEGKDTMKGFEKFIERTLKRKADMKT